MSEPMSEPTVPPNPYDYSKMRGPVPAAQEHDYAAIMRRISDPATWFLTETDRKTTVTDEEREV